MVSKSEEGGKAANLRRLAALGFRVPPFYVVAGTDSRNAAVPAAGVAASRAATHEGAGETPALRIEPRSVQKANSYQ